MYLISLAVILTIIFIVSIGSLPSFIDPASLIFILLITLPLLASTGLLKDFRRGIKAAFLNKSIYTLQELKRSEMAIKLCMVLLIVSGIFATIIGGISMINHMGNELIPTKLFAGLSVASLTTVYSTFLILLLVPILYKVKVLIIDEEVNNETDSK